MWCPLLSANPHVGSIDPYIGLIGLAKTLIVKRDLGVKHPAPAASIGPLRPICGRPLEESVVPAISADETPAGIAGGPTPLVDPPDRVWFPKPFSDIMSALSGVARDIDSLDASYLHPPALMACVCALVGGSTPVALSRTLPW